MFALVLRICELLPPVKFRYTSRKSTPVKLVWVLEVCVVAELIWVLEVSAGQRGKQISLVFV